MKKCPNCGRPATDDAARYCAYCSAALVSAPNYLPGEEPEWIKKHLREFFGELVLAYPTREIERSTWNSERWDAPADALRQHLGYESIAAFLAAYGFTVKAAPARRESGSVRPDMYTASAPSGGSVPFAAQQSARTENSGESTYPARGLLQSLSDRVLINGIIWLVIAGLQIVAGIVFLCQEMVNMWPLLVAGAWNILNGIRDLRYSKTVLVEPYDIVGRYMPLVMPIVIMVWNVLAGGVIGVGGSIYYLVGIRGFVMNNREYFESFDRRPAGEASDRQSGGRTPAPAYRPCTKPLPAEQSHEAYGGNNSHAQNYSGPMRPKKKTAQTPRMKIFLIVLVASCFAFMIFGIIMWICSEAGGGRGHATSGTSSISSKSEISAEAQGLVVYDSSFPTGAEFTCTLEQFVDNFNVEAQTEISDISMSYEGTAENGYDVYSYTFPDLSTPKYTVIIVLRVNPVNHRIGYLMYLYDLRALTVGEEVYATNVSTTRPYYITKAMGLEANTQYDDVRFGNADTEMDGVQCHVIEMTPCAPEYIAAMDNGEDPPYPSSLPSGTSAQSDTAEVPQENIEEQTDSARYPDEETRTEIEGKSLDVYPNDSDYVEESAEGTVFTDGNNLRLRRGPGKDYDIVREVPAGSIVEIYAERDGWVLTEYDGTWGWADSDYILAEDMEADSRDDEQDDTQDDEQVDDEKLDLPQSYIDDMDMYFRAELEDTFDGADWSNDYLDSMELLGYYELISKDNGSSDNCVYLLYRVHAYNSAIGVSTEYYWFGCCNNVSVSSSDAVSQSSRACFTNDAGEMYKIYIGDGYYYYGYESKTEFEDDRIVPMEGGYNWTWNVLE